MLVLYSRLTAVLEEMYYFNRIQDDTIRKYESTEGLYCTQQRIVTRISIYLSCTSCFPWVASSNWVHLWFCSNFCQSPCLIKGKKQKTKKKHMFKKKYSRAYVKFIGKECDKNDYILIIGIGTSLDNFKSLYLCFTF